MNKDIENIIKKNLPEKKKENYLSPDIRIDEQNGFNQALYQINTTLIADEVLKVVVEKIEKEFKFEYFLRSSSGNIVRSVISKKDQIRNEIVDGITKFLLSNLSPNKENENNERS